jgi:alkylation response protein AidB-like acyl-CoA dehydrogenase
VDATGTPERREVLFPVAECQILDTWRVTGLCGTGSHDFAVAEVFVPQAHSRPLGFAGAPGFTDLPRAPGPLYAFGAGVIPLTFAAVSLGIARGAVDAFLDLLTVGGPKDRLRDAALVQFDLGRAETQVDAARVFLVETVRELWASACAATLVTEDQIRRLTLVSAHAAFASARAVEALWYAHGAAAIFASNPLERRFRDAHVAAQRFSATAYQDAGRARLGATRG